jgi:hypothetical protein
MKRAVALALAGTAALVAAYVGASTRSANDSRPAAQAPPNQRSQPDQVPTTQSLRVIDDVVHSVNERDADR